MTISMIAVWFAVFTVVCLVTGVWLALHLTAVAAAARGRADVVPARVRPRATRTKVIAMATAFAVSLTGVIAMQIVAINA